MEFSYQSFPNKVYFGEVYLTKLPDIIKEIGGKKLFVIASNRTKAIVDDIIQSFGNENITVFSEIIQHVPKTMVEKALAAATKNQSDIIIAIGGGSAIGLAKGVALHTDLSILAIPTTYAGSEMTNTYGISSDGVKTVAKDLKVLPKTVIYIPSLTADMPLSLAATSSMNAMAHLIEAVYAFDINPITYQTALTGIRALKDGMEVLIKAKSLQNANEQLQFGSYLAGKCLCEVSMALHHKLAHTLGGSFGMEHGEVHTVLLPYVLDFQLTSLSLSLKNDLNKSLNTKNPALKLKTLAKQMGAKTTLKAIGFNETDIPKATEIIMGIKAFPNPVNISAQNITALLMRCFHGKL
jgi:alcohol dehydrogenase class IV